MNQGSNSARNYAQQLRNARQVYDRDLGYDRYAHQDYMAKCLYIALSILASEIAAGNPRLVHLGTGLSSSRDVVLGLVDAVADNLKCPIDNEDDHEDFIRSWYRHSYRLIDNDMPPVVKNILTHIQL